MHPKFEGFIMGCIIFNTLIMALKSFGTPTWFDTTMLVVNYFFAFLFTVECVIKLQGLGRKRYFMDNWNCFDFVVVVGTDSGILIKLITGINVAAIATVIRTFRVCRVVRLVQSLKDLRALINTLLVSLPSLFNITVLMMLILFIFSVMGVQQFALVAHSDAIDDHSNFQTFGVAFITLLRALTGENWNGQMYSLQTDVDGCNPAPIWELKKYEAVGGCKVVETVDGVDYCERDYPSLCGMEGYNEYDCEPVNGCGAGASAVIFWFLFTLVGTFVVLNVFVAVILEAFDDSADAEDAKLTDMQWNEFCEEWCNNVSKPVQAVPDMFKLPIEKLLPFLMKLNAPMGFKNPDGDGILHGGDVKIIDQIVADMGIDIITFAKDPEPKQQWADFTDVAVAVGRRVMVLAEHVVDPELLYAEFQTAEKLEKKASGRDLNKKFSGRGAQVQLNAKQYFAALRIACAFRSHKFRETIKERVEEDDKGQ